MDECKDRDPRPLEWEGSEEGVTEREKFEQWLKGEVDLVTLSEKSAAHRGWQAALSTSQAEIDALKAGNTHLRSSLDELFLISDKHIEQIKALKAEISLCNGALESRERNVAAILEASALLKAENEKLRKDVEYFRSLHPLTHTAVLPPRKGLISAPDTKGE